MYPSRSIFGSAYSALHGLLEVSFLATVSVSIECPRGTHPIAVTLVFSPSLLLRAPRLFSLSFPTSRFAFLPTFSRSSVFFGLLIIRLIDLRVILRIAVFAIRRFILPSVRSRQRNAPRELPKTSSHPSVSPLNHRPRPIFHFGQDFSCQLGLARLGRIDFANSTGDGNL